MNKGEFVIRASSNVAVHMRDGEVVLYLRPDSKVWPVRYKLFAIYFSLEKCFLRDDF